LIAEQKEYRGQYQYFQDITTYSAIKLTAPKGLKGSTRLKAINARKGTNLSLRFNSFHSNTSIQTELN